MDQQRSYWEKATRFMKLYLSQRDDPRTDQQDKWRANIFVPEPFINIESAIAVIHDILFSPDPPIQAEAVDDPNVPAARNIERLLDYTLRRNKWRRLMTGILRMARIQGTEFFKLVWANKTAMVNVYPDQQKVDDFQQALRDAFATLQAKGAMNFAGGVPDWMQDPRGFLAWRDEINKKLGPIVPAPPMPGPQEIVKYRGPWFERVPMYDVVLDPLVDELGLQFQIVHRLRKTDAWLKDQVQRGVYDEQAVAAGLKAGADTKLSEFEREINSMLGLNTSDDIAPGQQPPHEILEVWRVGQDVQYAVILNRAAVINKDPSQLPYEHSETALHAIRNIWVPGRFHGISDLQAPESLFEELNSLRNLRVDRTTLETYNSFTKMNDFGWPEQKRKLVPGGIIPTNRPNALEPIFKYQPTNAFSDMQMIASEIADTTGIYSSVRGAPAQINRVSATESRDRSQSALTRLKIQAVMAEEELQPVVDQMLGLWYQKGDHGQRIRVGGSPDPFITLDPHELFDSLEMEFRFRGATRALNKDLIVQQLTEFAKNFQTTLTPVELRATMKEILNTRGIKGVSQLVSDMGTQYFTEMFALQDAQVKQQMAAVSMQTQQMMVAAQQPQQPQAAPGQPQQAPQQAAAQPAQGGAAHV